MSLQMEIETRAIDHGFFEVRIDDATYESFYTVKASDEAQAVEIAKQAHLQ